MVRVEAFGVFVDLDCPAIGLLLVTHFEDGPRGFNIGEYPPVGASIDAVVVHHEAATMQIRLSTRASDMKWAR
ncbi:MAG: S1 RNA-binding domain-containing protein [Deltaproteobacteria bacterium]|nr:S1 RNA-binding domain-containing protein [Deltaproteobacteria bacterium]